MRDKHTFLRGNQRADIVAKIQRQDLKGQGAVPSLVAQIVLTAPSFFAVICLAICQMISEYIRIY